MILESILLPILLIEFSGTILPLCGVRPGCPIYRFCQKTQGVHREAMLTLQALMVSHTNFMQLLSEQMILKSVQMVNALICQVV